MKLKYILLLFFISATIISCFDDDTTYDTQKISVISIDTTKLQKVYNIDKNQTQTITPVISQTDPTQKLTYEWQLDYKTYSDSSAFKYLGEELGSYAVRLKVSNSSGSTFYTFTLNVNSPYEEGITLLSEDKEGTPMLSFMRKYSAEELASGKIEAFETHCLITNNPEIQFARKPTDIAKRVNQLFISFKESPSIYILNTKTLEVENIVSAPEFPDFVPERMHIPDNEARSSVVLCENGKIYDVATLEGLIMQDVMLNSAYEKMNIFYTGPNNYSLNSYLWDKNEQTLCMYNGYNVINLKEYGLFDGHQPVAMFDGAAYDYFTVITQKNGTFYKTSLGYNLISYEYDDDWNIIGTTLDLREQKEVSGHFPLTATTPYASNSDYKQLVYAVGNKLYRWYFSDNSFPTSDWASIDLEGAEITSLTYSPDETQLYVGVYQPNESGLNGHLYILDSDTGKLVGDQPYLNIGYKPIKIMYKVK